MSDFIENKSYKITTTLARFRRFTRLVCLKNEEGEPLDEDLILLRSLLS